jgi:hypothetical protein
MAQFHPTTSSIPALLKTNQKNGTCGEWFSTAANWKNATRFYGKV